MSDIFIEHADNVLCPKCGPNEYWDGTDFGVEYDGLLGEYRCKDCGHKWQPVDEAKVFAKADWQAYHDTQPHLLEI